MAHLVDKQVAGRVILQPAPGTDPKSKRVSVSFQHINGEASKSPPRLHRCRSASCDDGPEWRPMHQKGKPMLPIKVIERSRDGGESRGAEDSKFLRPTLRRRGSCSPQARTPASRSDALSGFDDAMTAAADSSPSAEEKQIVFREDHRTFHLRAGECQYSFCVDRNGSLEHLYFGPWVGTSHDLTYLSESDPALTFEPAPAGAQYTTTELLRLMGEEKVDSRQLWSLSTHMKFERNGDWHMTRVENLTWRLRHLWTDQAAGLDAEDVSDAEAVLKILDRSNVPFTGLESSGTTPRGEKKGRQGEKGSKLLEVSEFGTGDFRNPSLEIIFRHDGSRLLPLIYQQHRVVDGVVPSCSGVPLLGARDSFGVQTLVVDLVDPYTELKVQLLYTIFPGLPVVSRRMMVRNCTRVGTGDVDLLKCMSATFDFLTNDWHLVSLHGGWASERQITVRRLLAGTTDLSSRRGVSSHQMNPCCVLTAGPPCEDHGLCYGISLLYSGNWLMEVEQSETGCVRLNAGINPTQFSWVLGTNETFETPECVCVLSNQGLGGVTRTFHQLFNTYLIHPRWRSYTCPVLINTWEALYFKVFHENIMKLARPAKEVGVELLVLDDGWFGQRDDDSSSLGDWKPDERKLPRGLHGLAKDLNELGLKLGIWMEPEMVNMASELFRAHPEWVLHHPNRVRSEGRNQLVLDLSRREVQDYIIESVTSVLSSANIEYVKWDMNRALTDAYSAKLPPSQQGEVYHRYVLGLYRVFETITERFPNVLIESCASGGGRFDPALLAWCPQAWTSDNTDAFSRTCIQMGTSLWAPVRCMGSHLTTCPNHQTHRSVMMKTRFIVSLWGTFGLELDLTKMSPEELEEVKAVVALRHKLCKTTLHGVFYRLPGFAYPGGSHGNSAGIGQDSNVFAWMFVSPDQSHAVVSSLVFHRDTVGRFPSRLMLRGLQPDVEYDLEEHVPTPVEQGVFNGIFQAGGHRYKHQRRLRLSGAVLMNVGLPIHFNFDGDSVLLELTAVPRAVIGWVKDPDAA